MNTRYNDKQLLTLIAQGDEHAFRQLFDQYRNFIYFFALRLTESDLIAKDVVQEVFIKLWLQRTSLTEVISLKAWIYRLTRNHVLNGLKRKAHETALLNEIRQTLPETHEPTAETILYRELERLLQEAVQQLPAQQQKAYTLSRGEGLKHDEIAGQLQISSETVKKHIMAAVQSIRAYLSRHGNLLPTLLLICC